MSGRIPTELVREARGGEVHVNMEDHKTEEFSKSKVSKKPFGGVGHMLGGAVPEVVGSGASAGAAAPAPAGAAATEAGEQAAKERFPVNEAQPVTSLQVRLNDGSRLVIKVIMIT